MSKEYFVSVGQTNVSKNCRISSIHLIDTEKALTGLDILYMTLLIYSADTSISCHSQSSRWTFMSGFATLCEVIRLRLWETWRPKLKT